MLKIEKKKREKRDEFKRITSANKKKHNLLKLNK